MIQDLLPILYEDDALLIVNKPSGMLIHRGWATADIVLVDLIRTYLDATKVHPVHRLDRATSGVVMIAKTVEVARQARTWFSERSIDKRYIAIVRGESPESGTIDHPIPRKEKGERVDSLTLYTRIEVLTTEPRNLSVIEAQPKTGRLHQIRRHLKHINHPIIGDSRYGKGPLNRAFAAQYNLSRLALHAASLSFMHPTTEQRITIKAPLPNDLIEPLKAMGSLRVVDEHG